MRGAWRRVFLYLVVLAALAALAYYSRHRIHLGDFTWHKFTHAVGQANPWLLLLAFVAIYACYGIRALRWQRFCKHLGRPKYDDVFTGTIMGFAAIFVLGRPGEAVRPLLLARKCRLPVASMFGIWALERIFDFGAAVALASLTLLVFTQKLSDAGANTDWLEHARPGGWALLAMLAGVIAVMIYFRLHGAGILDRRMKQWHGKSGWKRRITTVVTGFSEGLQAIRTPSDLLAALFYTAAHWALVAMVYLWVSQAFASEFTLSSMNFPGAMLLLAVTLVGATLQLPGVGGGAQVASFIALTSIFGVEQEPAAAMAFLLWIITFASPALMGLPLLIHEGLSMGDLRRLARDEAQAEDVGAHVGLGNGATTLNLRQRGGDAAK
jgi:uncharacterized protein (TIRG00374 family)